MMGKLSSFASPEIELLLNKLQADEDNYTAELRSLDREKMVLPVQLITPDAEFAIQAFSRNISPGGVGLITPQPFSAGTEMFVELQFQNGKLPYRATCKWCTKFSAMYWTSGWELDSGVELNVAGVKALDATVEDDIRATDREKYAIPLVIHQKGNQSRIHGFTRNMSGEGVNLIAREGVALNSHCMLEFIRKEGERCSLIAECVWVKKFGESHWMTGWKFPRLEKDAQDHAASFDLQ